MAEARSPILTSNTVAIVTTAFSLLVPCIYHILIRRSASSKDNLAQDRDSEDDISDPTLLRKHSSHESHYVPQTGFAYPSLRIFFRPHDQGDKLPVEPTPVPLLVCVHGLGGSIAQFHPLLLSLVNIAPALVIDLPGCGLSSFEPKAWNAYTCHALVHLLAVIIEKYRDRKRNQGIILVGHSMGCSLAALLASATSPYKDLVAKHMRAVVAICPRAEPLSGEQVSIARTMLTIPGPIFDLWRRWDRRGGTESASVARFIGPEAEQKTRKLQLLFNEQSRTPVWRRMVSGALPNVSSELPVSGLPGRDIWIGIRSPLFLVAGEADQVTPADNVRIIAEWFGREARIAGGNERRIASDPSQQHGLTPRAGNIQHPVPSARLTKQPNSPPTKPPTSNPGFKAIILPSPASHALLYDERTARILSAHLQHFLASHVDNRLNLGWQLHYLNREGKWDVKNLSKWSKVAPVSKPVANFFRAMKTLREVDETHTPKVFVEEWAPGKGRGKDGLGAIAVVIDITHDSPVYDAGGLEKGGIAYRKFPTISKFPPTREEVELFVQLVDSLRVELDLDMKVGGEGIGGRVLVKRRDGVEERVFIAVHCHYGYNRTGFFIVSYLVERLGWGVKDAIEEFKEKRPGEIKHDHFVDELFARY